MIVGMNNDETRKVDSMIAMGEALGRHKFVLIARLEDGRWAICQKVWRYMDAWVRAEKSDESIVEPLYYNESVTPRYRYHESKSDDHIRIHANDGLVRSGSGPYDKLLLEYDTFMGKI